MSSSSRSLVIHPFVRSQSGPSKRDPTASLDEAVGLVRAINVDVVLAETVVLSRLHPATLIGQGTIERLGVLIEHDSVELAVVDFALTPVQQRNLERAWKCKVIDRTGLILEIFGERARTREGRLQVELAALSYQRSRLVRSWTHLERQRGGFGFMGGPGETQIEADRRLIGERIARLTQELDEVKRTRHLHRSARKRVPYPIVALVGYTNAGKSTLFNALTKASVFAEDLLFATLDPTMRSIVLPSGRKVILSDTVGFISNLPTELIAAFRATLEEVLEADLIIHVRDISHPDTEAQRNDVEETLRSLGIEKEDMSGYIEALNKIDLVSEERRSGLISLNGNATRNHAVTGMEKVALSARSGEGLDHLRTTLDRHLGRNDQIVTISLPLTDGAGAAWLYRHGEVMARRDDDEQTHIRVRLSTQNLQKLYRRRRSHVEK